METIGVISGIIIFLLIFLVLPRKTQKKIGIFIIFVFVIRQYNLHNKEINKKKNYEIKQKTETKIILPKKQYKTKVHTQNYYLNTYQKSNYSTSRIYYRGPRGGCYYINSNGNKSYVDRSLCN